MKHFYFLIFSLVLLSCKQENSSSSYNSNPESLTSNYQTIDEMDEESSIDFDDEYNGTYCAEVEYYNPNTGTRSTYELDVEVEDGYLVQIDWPNGGWLDETHFISEDISSGECSFTSDRGYKYTVTLGEKGGGCYSEGYRLRNQVNEDVENTTCPKCGEEKDEYDDYCSSCESEISRQKQEEEEEQEELRRKEDIDEY